MAISPPSDIVLDVARAADPAAMEAAKTAIARHATLTAPDFAADLGTEIPRGDLAVSTLERSRAGKHGPDPYTRFEAMVMQSFVQTMLPRDTGSVYGEGMAGDMWKSQMAEQISTVIAERGGIGIADRILRSHYVDGDQKIAMSGAPSEAAQAAGERRNSLSTALLQELQRTLNSGLVADTTVKSGKS